MARWLAFDAANQSFVSYDSRREAREAAREQPELRFSERVNGLARQQAIPDYTSYYYVSRYASTEEGRTLGKQTMEAIQLYGLDYDGAYSYQQVSQTGIDMSEAVRAGFIRYRRKGK